MANIPDDFGRLGRFSSADFEEIKKALTVAVGDAVKFNSESKPKQEKVETKNVEELVETLSELVKVLGDSQENIKENIKATKEFVEEVKQASEQIKVKKQKAKKETVPLGGNLQNAQKIILQNQQRAEKEKINKFTSGAAILESARPSVSKGDSFERISRAFSPRKSTITSRTTTREIEKNSIKENEDAANNILGTIARMFSLKSLGFKPKGADTVPAVLAPGELVVSKKNTDKLKSGSHTLAFSKGGIVKPQYLSKGNEKKSIGTRAIEGFEGVLLKPMGFEFKIEPEIGEPKNKDKAAQQMEEIGKSMADRLNSKFEAESKRDLAAWATGMSSMLLGGGANFLQAIFAGSVKDATEYRQEARKLAYELEGLTEKERGLQAGFSDLGDVYGQTGKRAEVMQRVLLSNVKKGLKNNVETKKVMKSSLHLSTMIGSNAEQTADLFGDWHRTLGLGADQMSRLANDSKLLARSTGITGDELIGVMKSSEGILKNLRNQGNLTSDSTRNVIKAMAHAKKMGIEDEAKNIFDMMSSSHKLLTGDEKTRAFIYGMANRSNDRKMINAATTGSLTKDRGMMKKFAGEMDRYIKELTGYENAEELLEKGTDDEKFRAGEAVQSFAGMDLYTYSEFGKGLTETSKSLEETLADFDKKIKSPAATAEEKQAAERQKRETVLFESFGKMQEFSSQLEKGGEKGEKFDQILQRSFEKMSEDQKTDLKYLEKTLSSTDQARLSGLSDPMRAQMAANLVANQKLQETAAAQGKTVKDFGPELEAALKSGKPEDMEKYRSSVKEMDESMKNLGVKERDAIDPMMDLAGKINDLNQTIRSVFGGLTGQIVDLIGGFVLFGIQVGLLITSLYATFGDKFLELTGLGKLIPKIEKIAKLRSPAVAASVDDVAKNPFASMGGSMGQTARKTSGITGAVDDVVAAQETIFGKFKSRLGRLAQSFDDFFYRPIRRGLTRVQAGARNFQKMLSDYENARKFGSIDGKMLPGSMRATGKFGSGASVKDSFTHAFKTPIDKFKKTFASLLPKRFKKAFASARTPKFGLGWAEAPKGIFKSLGIGIKAQLLGFVDDIVKVALRLGTKIKQASAIVAGGLNRLWEGTKAFTQVPFAKRIESFMQGMRGLWNGIPSTLSKAKNLFTGGKGIGNLIEGGILGTFKTLSKGISGGAKLFKGAARLSPLTIAFAAVDAAFGAVQGWQNAGENFKGVMKSGIKGMEKLTFGMQISSSAGGALAGVLDGLTLGLLSLIGLKDGLAQFLGYVIYAFGVLGHAIGEGFGTWLKPIQESLSALGKAFLGIFNAIMGIFGFEGASDMAGAFAGLYKILQPLGYAIGWLVGGALKLLIDVIWVVAKVVEGLAAAFKFVLSPITALVGVIGRMVSGVVDWFMWLYKVVFGNSIIPDLCIGIVAVFAKMAIKVLGALGSFVFKVIKFFAMLPFKILGFFIKLPFKIMGAMYRAFVKGPIALFTKLMNFLTGGLFSKGLTALSTKVGEFFSLFKKYLWDFAKIAFQSWYKLLNWISGGWLDKIVKGISNLGGKIVTLVDDYLIKPISSAFQKIATLVDDYLIKPIIGLVRKVMSYLPKWMTGADDAARAAANAAKVGSRAATATDDVAKGAAKAAEVAAKGASATDDVAKGAVKATELAAKGTTLVDDAAKVAISGADDVAKAGASGLGGTAGRAAGGLAKKIPVLGPLIDFGIRKAMGQDTVQATGGAVSGGVGALGGAAAGAALGSVVPVVGTAIGGVIGGIIGGIGGGMLWDSGYEAVTGKGEDKALGEAQIGTTMVEQGDAQLAQGEIISTTMQMAQEPGSMYVHDTHVEAVLLMILESLNSSGVSKGVVGGVGGTMGGAMAGALAGTAILPGLGTIAGAMIGSGALGGVGGMFGLGGKKEKTVGKKDFSSDKITGALEGSRELEAKQAQQGEITSETMKMAQEPGSMYVHDTHCEALLYLILKQLGWDESKGLEEYNKVMKNLKDSPERGIEKILTEVAIKKKEEEANDYTFWRGAKQTEALKEAERLKGVVKDIEKGGKAQAEAAGESAGKAASEVKKSADKSEKAAEATKKAAESSKAKEEKSAEAAKEASKAASEIQKSSEKSEKAAETTAKAADASAKKEKATEAASAGISETKNEDGTYTLELPAGRFQRFDNFDSQDFNTGLRTTTLETKSSAEMAANAKRPEDYLVDDMGPQRIRSDYDPSRYLTEDSTEAGRLAQARNFSDRVLERARMQDAQNAIPAGVESMEGRQGALARFVAADTIASAAQGQSATFEQNMSRMPSKSFDAAHATEEKLAQKQSEIEQNTASVADSAARAAESAARGDEPGSIYVHDIHAEKILQHLLGQVGVGNADALKLANEKVGSTQELGSQLIKQTMEANKATTDSISKSNQDSNRFTEDLFNKKPQIPDSVYAPIADLENKTIGAIENASIAASVPVGQHAIPIARTSDQEDTVNGVQPVHLRDISDTILRDRTSTQAGTNKLQSDELTRMEEVANKQVQELTEIKEGIKQVVHLLTPKGTSIAGQSSEQMEGRTKDPRRPLHAVAMGKMKYKGPGSTANRATINTGEC